LFKVDDRDLMMLSHGDRGQHSTLDPTMDGDGSNADMRSCGGDTEVPRTSTLTGRRHAK
jgi:hypothetical protein